MKMERSMWTAQARLPREEPAEEPAAPSRRRARVLAMLDRLRGRKQESPELPPRDAPAEEMVPTRSTVELLDRMLAMAAEAGVSDLHIEPGARCARVRIRMDGMIHTWFELPTPQYVSLLARIKVLAGLDIAERYRPQDGRFSFSGESKTIHLRVAVMPTQYGETAVLRLLSERPALDHADQFGMADAVYQRFCPLLDRPGGLVYFTGPTGTGKTTTLYLVLEELNRRGRSLATIEDPIERQIDGVCQTQINPAAGLTFETGLRALLRQDPDALLVGETRDPETARLSVRAALAGHAVYSTLHTRNALGAVARLTDMGVEPYLLADALSAVVAQRLLRKVCPACAAKTPPTRQDVQVLGADIAGVRRGRGCPACHNTGYSGRVAIHELVLVDAPLREDIAGCVSTQQMRAGLRRRQQLPTLREQAVALARAGLTTPEEVLRTTEPD